MEHDDDLTGAESAAPAHGGDKIPEQQDNRERLTAETHGP